MHKLEENIKQAVYPSDMIVHTIFSTKAITVMLTFPLESLHFG